VSLHEGIEALEYWRGRRARLAWYRRRDRREAELMVARWERRVRVALLSDPHAPIGARIEGGLLVMCTHAGAFARRWGRRISLAALVGAALAGGLFAALVNAIF
jgi:hypothetical protein